MNRTFRSWLLAEGVITPSPPIWDLATDVSDDRSSTTVGDTPQEWQAHLHSRGACLEALGALREAWALYRPDHGFRWEANDESDG